MCIFSLFWNRSTQLVSSVSCKLFPNMLFQSLSFFSFFLFKKEWIDFLNNTEFCAIYGWWIMFEWWVSNSIDFVKPVSCAFFLFLLGVVVLLMLQCSIMQLCCFQFWNWFQKPVTVHLLLIDTCGSNSICSHFYWSLPRLIAEHRRVLTFLRKFAISLSVNTNRSAVSLNAATNISKPLLQNFE